MENTNRRTLTGTVVSDKMDKTIVVLVETYKNHAKYQKRVKRLWKLDLYLLLNISA